MTSPRATNSPHVFFSHYEALGERSARSLPAVIVFGGSANGAARWRRRIRYSQGLFLKSTNDSDPPQSAGVNQHWFELTNRENGWPWQVGLVPGSFSPFFSAKICVTVGDRGNQS